MIKFILKYWIEIVMLICFALIMCACTPRYISVENAANGKAKCGQWVR